MKIVELKYDELKEIDAGESFWYWIVYQTRVTLEYLNEAGKGCRMHSCG